VGDLINTPQNGKMKKTERVKMEIIAGLIGLFLIYLTLAGMGN
jgi:hypothetical protein